MVQNECLFQICSFATLLSQNILLLWGYVVYPVNKIDNLFVLDHCIIIWQTKQKEINYKSIAHNHGLFFPSILCKKIVSSN